MAASVANYGSGQADLLVWCATQTNTKGGASTMEVRGRLGDGGRVCCGFEQAGGVAVEAALADNKACGCEVQAVSAEL